MAQSAIQQAKNLGNNLKQKKGKWAPFKYKDKGSLAIIGRNKAVLDTSKQKYNLKGFIAWFIWVFIHIMSLVSFRNKLKVAYSWFGYYLSKDQSFRMIIKPRERTSNHK